jgi:hypothetical protein
MIFTFAIMAASIVIFDASPSLAAGTKGGCVASFQYAGKASDLATSQAKGSRADIFTQNISYPDDYLARMAGVDGPGSSYVRFGWSEDFADGSFPIYWYEAKDASGNYYNDTAIPGPATGTPLIGFNNWVPFTISDTDGNEVWKANSQGQNIFTTRDLGFSSGRPYVAAYRTDCDSGGLAQFRDAKFYTASGSWHLVNNIGCWLDTDPGHHWNIQSDDDATFPDGQSAGGCAGTT